MKNVYSYVFDLRNRLEETCAVVRDNLIKAQAVNKMHLDKLPNLDNYIDDVLINNDTLKEHMSSLRVVFQRILNAGLTIKPSKCYIGHSAVSFVGHKIIQGKLQTRQESIENIAKASPYSKTLNRYDNFGVCGYYRKFVPQYADISAPLVNLTKKASLKL